MAALNHAEAIAQALKETTQRQVRAADPLSSVWVSANAGTGKTHVLTMRTLRLLLCGTEPERILCLTYTKAAAAEMSERVFKALAKWVTASDEELANMLQELLQRPASSAELLRARTLFAFAIETPGGLKVQTIHAFCERLLQRFPLEAGVPPGFSILDDDMVRSMQREAIDGVLLRATLDPESELGQALKTVVAYASDDRFDDLLASAIAERSFLDTVSRFEENDGSDSGLPGNIDELLRDTVGVRRDLSVSGITEELCCVLRDDEVRRLVDVLSSGSKNDVKLSAGLRGAVSRPAGDTKARCFEGFFLTGSGKRRARLMTKALSSAHPDLETAALRAQDLFCSLWRERIGLRAVEASLALFTLSGAVLQGYSDLKARRAGLDYEDLIEKSANLLASSDNADWVLFKLDGGLDHILVDESQDTSPAQWQIIEALAKEFFSGDGAREQIRTLFAVGDEKQSIYSFQGAAPEQFSTMGKRFEKLCRDAKRSWSRVPLSLSFRSVPPVLQAVDRVFRDKELTPGVGTGEELIAHEAARFGRGGLVEVWPTIKPHDTGLEDIWSPESDETHDTPAQALANKIGDTIQGWLADGERLLSENRPIMESDILILVRKRNPFAGPMVAALKARGIAVAGADRVDLMAQIAVQDLVALGDFLVLPEDDLALACVLKSPMFGLDDHDLFQLAHGRRGTLWKALLDARGKGGKFESAAVTLLSWRKRADFLPPYEFYSSLLDVGGMRAKILSRLGSEAAEPLDEFLNLMISFDEGAPPSLSGFLSWLRGGRREIKRDMEQGSAEVRVMTVHGAKGLEAPIVFLPDTCTTSSGGGTLSGLIKLDAPRLPSGMRDLMMWKVKGSRGIEAFTKASERQGLDDRKERNRLLYVAMTRARDRLYVCGFEGKRGRDKGCWFDVISSGLEPIAETLPDDGLDGGRVLRISAKQTHSPPDRPKQALSQAHAMGEPPIWATRPAPVEPDLSVPLSPSKLAPYDIDEDGEPAGHEARREDTSPGPVKADAATSEPGFELGTAVDIPLEPALLPARALDDERRFLRGTLTHALLEHLPRLEPEAWLGAAYDYVKARGALLSKTVRKSIIKETIAILEDPQFGVLFGNKSQAEVSIGADIPRPEGSGPPLRLSGMIDRLAVLGDEVFIVDYKTNRFPPAKVEDVSESYLFQLAAYRLALLEIYRGKTVCAAIMWTQSARLMEIPETVLVNFGSQLWELA